jgi:DNA-binding beta-propeller fold protein YncE
MAVITVAPGRCWQYSHYVGRQSTAGTGFSSPIGVALGKDDTLYVANRNNPRVTKATVGQEFIKEFGRGIPEQVGAPFPSRHMWLTAVVLDKDENVYVADEWHNSILVYNSDGDILTNWGEQGEGEGKLNRPSGMVFDADDNLWIVNSANSRIQKFSPDGTHLLSFGSGKPAGISHDGGTPYSHSYMSHIAVNPNDLNHPTGVAVDGEGDVYVVDWMNERVVIFDSQARTMATLRGEASGLSKWAEQSIAANPDMAKARGRVKTPEMQNYFRMPVACIYDRAGDRLMVCDTLRSRIQIYHKEGDYLDPQSNL